MADKDKKKYYWLKLKEDFFKRHDIRIIETMPNGKDYIIFYLKLLCESCGREGRLRFSEEIPYNEEMLATITNTNVDVVRSAVKIFSQLHMIDILDDGTYFLTQVQKMVGSETGKAIRMREYHERKKLESRSNNAHLSLEIEKEKEIDLEKEKEDKLDKKDKPLTSDFCLNNLTQQLIKRNFICEGDLDLFNYNNFFSELLLTYEYELICRVVNYVLARMKTNDEIENKFGYFKTSVLENINNIESLKAKENDPFNWLNW